MPLLLLVASLAALAPAPARARLHLWVDAPLSLGLGASWAALYLASGSLARPSCPCRPEQVQGPDRLALGHAWRSGERAANAALALALAGSAGAALALSDDLGQGGEALALGVESALLAGLLGQVVKVAASRPWRASPALKALLWAGGPLLALGAGALELTAGNHFPTDIAAGAAAGAALAAANIWLHQE